MRSEAARRVLIADRDPSVRSAVAAVLRTDDLHLVPVEVLRAEDVPAVLEQDPGLEALVLDLGAPGREDLSPLVRARAQRSDLKIVATSASPSEDLFQAALDSGADWLLATPFELEDLPALLNAGRVGMLTHLRGDLDLVDLLQISAVRHPEGGLRIRGGGREAVLAHSGSALVHVEEKGRAGEPAITAFSNLSGWGSWTFESLPALSSLPLRESCDLGFARGSRPRTGGKAEGRLRGLTLKDLLEWAIQTRQTCTFLISSARRVGELGFEGGRIRRAEAGRWSGGRAAAEILSWESLRVEVIRMESNAEEPVEAATSLKEIFTRFGGEVEGLVASAVVRMRDGVAVESLSTDPALDPALAATAYLPVVRSHLAALLTLGGTAGWGDTEDILITTSRAHLLIRILGQGRYYQWLAVSTEESNLALCRLLLRSYEPLLLEALGEKPAA